MLDIASKIDFLAQYYHLKLHSDWQVSKGYRHEIEEQLFSAFQDNGFIQYAEMGCPPAEYLPSAIHDYLDLLDDKDWSLAKVTTNDGWQTASVTLQHKSGEDYPFIIEGVDGSDWVPGDLSVKMEIFSKAKCNKTFMTFFSDDPYLILALPHQAAEELESIIDNFSEPYD